MSPRQLVRIVLVIAVLILLWRRIGFITGPRLIGVIVISLLLLLAVGLQAMRKPRDPRADVPKRPLGLE